MMPPIVIAGAAGPFVGSFLGVLIRRLPVGRPVVVARSACEACGHVLGPAELVPLASYAVLGGRCRTCGQPIGRFHPAVELAATAVPLLLLAAGIRDAATVAAGCVLGWALLALGWIDARTFLLPDVLTLPLIVAGLAACAMLSPELLTDRAAAAAGGYLAIRLVGWGYRGLRGRQGIGQGDAKLLAAGGAWVGVAGLSPVLLAGAVLGLAMAGILVLRGRTVGAGTRLPFGPALSAGIFLVWLWLNAGSGASP